MNTAEQTLFLLKTRGPQTAQQLAVLLGLTSMGARRPDSMRRASAATMFRAMVGTGPSLQS